MSIDPQVKLIWKEVIEENGQLSRQLVRKTFGKPKLTLVPQVGYVSFFPFMSRIIPPVSFFCVLISVIFETRKDQLLTDLNCHNLLVDKGISNP